MKIITDIFTLCISKREFLIRIPFLLICDYMLLRMIFSTLSVTVCSLLLESSAFPIYLHPYDNLLLNMYLPSSLTIPASLLNHPCSIFFCVTLHTLSFLIHMLQLACIWIHMIFLMPFPWHLWKSALLIIQFYRIVFLRFSTAFCPRFSIGLCAGSLSTCLNKYPVLSSEPPSKHSILLISVYDFYECFSLYF